METVKSGFLWEVGLLVVGGKLGQEAVLFIIRHFVLCNFFNQ